MADLISTVAYVLTVWLFALHLIFDRRFRRRLRTLARQQHQLERRLAAMSRQDSWVLGNSAFSYAPWAVVCLSGAYYRVAARHLRKDQVASSQSVLTEAAAAEQSQRAYRCCFDLYGYFGDVGSYGSLKELTDEGCRLLKLSFPVSAPEAEAAAPEPSVPVVQPEVVPANQCLPPLFSSRFN